MIVRVTSLICFTLVVAAACNPSNPEPTAGSESHFLMACDDACGGGFFCHCGACTSSCATTNDCTKFGGAAACVQPVQGDAGPSCEQAQTGAHCDVPCSTATDCEAFGGGYFCSRGYCRPDLLSQPNEPEAGFGLLCQQSTVACETGANTPSLVGSYTGQTTVKLSSNALWAVAGTDTFSTTISSQATGVFSGTVSAPSVTLDVTNATLRGNASRFTLYISTYAAQNGCNLETRAVVSGTVDSATSPVTLTGGLALRFTGNYSGAECTQEQIDVYPDTGANFTYSATKAP